ncbi:MAG: condensation domain-containing protein, partial [Blastocatellia bacterium]
MSTVRNAGYRNGEEQESVNSPSQQGGGEVEVYPLSFAQQRLWFLDQWNPGNTAYNIPAAIRLKGTLNRRALEQSLNEIVRRHEALRTTFSFENEEPVQVIAPEQPFNLEMLDLTELPEPAREARAVELATEEADLPFDLSEGPLIRGSLLRLGEKDHALLLTMHHIISDGWSMGVFIQELAPLYEAFATGKPPSLPDLPIQYADFAVWQRENLRGEALEKQLSYWRQQLGGEIPVLELPTDHPRPPTETFNGAQLSKTLSQTLSREINASCHRESVTLFMYALATFNVLLHRYTGQRDIIIGTPIANRNRPEIEPLIGFFVNTLVIRTGVSADLTFRELLAQVREATLAAYENQDVPFETLVQELQPQRDASRSPLFQVLFVVQNAPMPPLQLQGLELSLMPIEAGGSKFDLTLVVQEEGESIVLSIEYNTDLFETDTIERMLSHLETLFEGVVRRPEEKVARVRMMTEAELRRILVDWNDTAADFPRHLCLHDLFERQA